MLALVAIMLGALDVPLPPPPPGMKLIASAEFPAQVDQAPTGAAEGDEPSAELEAVRALENAAFDENAINEAALRASIQHLGYGTSSRDALETALRDLETAGEAPAFELPRVSNLARLDVERLKAEYDIPVEMQPLVAQYIRFFQGPGRRWFRNWMSRSTRFMPLMQPILESQGLPRDLVYLSMIESGFSTSANSWAHAVGPWQFIAGTGRMFNLKSNFWVDERRDPVKSTIAAGQYLGQLYREFGHWYLAWAGYNSGGGTVRHLVDRRGTKDFWALSMGRGMPKETQHYVPKLIACALVARHPEAFGFSQEEFSYEPAFTYDEVKLTEQVDTEVVARAAGVSGEAIRELNPELKRFMTPPASAAQPYVLRVPAGTAAAFNENFAQVRPTDRVKYAVHKVARGDTLSGIASRYHSATEAILQVNNLAPTRALRVGTELLVPTPSPSSVKDGTAVATMERRAAVARRAGIRALRPEEEVPAGTAAAHPGTTGGTVQKQQVGGKTRVMYGVASGDSLWTISQKFDVSVGELRNWNASLPRGGRGLKVGMALLIWPGPKARFND